MCFDVSPVIQPEHSLDRPRHFRRNVDRAGACPVWGPLEFVALEWDVEGLRHIGCGSFQLDRAALGRDFGHRKVVLLGECLDLVDRARIGAVSGGEFLPRNCGAAGLRRFHGRLRFEDHGNFENLVLRHIAYARAGPAPLAAWERNFVAGHWLPPALHQRASVSIVVLVADGRRVCAVPHVTPGADGVAAAAPGSAGSAGSVALLFRTYPPAIIVALEHLLTRRSAGGRRPRAHCSLGAARTRSPTGHHARTRAPSRRWL